MATNNTLTGAVSGAQAGASFGPWGALFGAFAGGLIGSNADEKAKEARALLKKVNALRTDATILRSFSEQRLLLRQGAVARANAVSEGVASGAELESSGIQGALGSIRNQMLDNFLLGQSILDEQLDANAMERKANRLLGQSTDTMGIIAFGSSVASMIPQGSKNSNNSTSNAPSLNKAFDTTLVNPGGIQTVNSSGSYYG